MLLATSAAAAGQKYDIASRQGTSVIVLPRDPKASKTTLSELIASSNITTPVKPPKPPQ